MKSIESIGRAWAKNLFWAARKLEQLTQHSPYKTEDFQEHLKTLAKGLESINEKINFTKPSKELTIYLLENNQIIDELVKNFLDKTRGSRFNNLEINVLRSIISTKYVNAFYRLIGREPVKNGFKILRKK